jgi:putrescine transport system substrate-binding protein
MGRASMRGALALLLCLLAGTAAAEERVVNVYNWSDYIDPAAIERFQRESGITVRYDVYDSLETLEGKLLAGHSGYDVVVPTNEPTFSRLIRAGALRPLDRARLPHLAGLDPALMALVAASDPGNRFGAIYLWGTTGLGTNPDRIRALAPDAPLDSWQLLLDPAVARRVAPCGITIMDTPADVIPPILKALGRDPHSTEAADLDAVARALGAIRPYVRSFSSGAAINELASGETCLAMTYSGDVIQARARAEEAKKGVTVRYVAPREGSELSFDMLAIPADAPHVEEALAFIDFVLRPDVMAGITNQVRYANAVPASKPMIRPEVADDPNIYPPPEQLARDFVPAAVPPAAERARTRLWARFKAGN